MKKHPQLAPLADVPSELRDNEGQLSIPRKHERLAFVPATTQILTLYRKVTLKNRVIPETAS